MSSAQQTLEDNIVHHYESQCKVRSDSLFIRTRGADKISLTCLPIFIIEQSTIISINIQHAFTPAANSKINFIPAIHMSQEVEKNPLIPQGNLL